MIKHPKKIITKHNKTHTYIKLNHNTLETVTVICRWNLYYELSLLLSYQLKISLKKTHIKYCIFLRKQNQLWAHTTLVDNYNPSLTRKDSAILIFQHLIINLRSLRRETSINFLKTRLVAACFLSEWYLKAWDQSKGLGGLFPIPKIVIV